jgi:hypothetical protein
MLIGVTLAPRHSNQPPHHLMAPNLRTKSTKDVDDAWYAIARSHPGDFRTMSGASTAKYSVQSLGVMKRREFFRACMRGVIDDFLECRIFNHRDNSRANELWQYFIDSSKKQIVWLDNLQDRSPWRDMQTTFVDTETGESLFNESYQLLKVGWHRGFELAKLHRLLVKWRDEDANEEVVEQSTRDRQIDDSHSPAPDTVTVNPVNPVNPVVGPSAQERDFLGTHRETTLREVIAALDAFTPAQDTVTVHRQIDDSHSLTQDTVTVTPVTPVTPVVEQSAQDRDSLGNHRETTLREVIAALDGFKKRAFVQPSEQEAPRGFRLRVDIRKSGRSAGKPDFYVYTPDPGRKKLRSVPELARFIMSNWGSTQRGRR